MVVVNSSPGSTSILIAEVRIAQEPAATNLASQSSGRKIKTVSRAYRPTIKLAFAFYTDLLHRLRFLSAFRIT
jgi:hypothetical protein